jgi:hypothetical protein
LTFDAVIIQRLSALGIDGEEFATQLLEHKAVMAGSFPLQCVLGETYPESDIDGKKEFSGHDVFPSV